MGGVQTSTGGKSYAYLGASHNYHPRCLWECGLLPTPDPSSMPKELPAMDERESRPSSRIKKARYTLTGRLCFLETCPCAGRPMAFGWGSTTGITVHFLYRA
eukprot:12232486-Heterocapsa_arctica.AAC.1